VVLEYKKLEELADSVKNGLVFYIKDYEEADLVFRRLEVFLCPDKEVYLPLSDEVKD
jgi:hypothetical protein